MAIHSNIGDISYKIQAPKHKIPCPGLIYQVMNDQWDICLYNLKALIYLINIIEFTDQNLSSLLALPCITILTKLIYLT